MAVGFGGDQEMHKLVGVVLAMLAASGCGLQRAEQRLEIARDARDQLIGMTKSGGGTKISSTRRSDGGVFGLSTRVSTKPSCKVDIVMSGGTVTRVNYLPTGRGELVEGEQCAYAVRACVPEH
jgi:hypothetical protein